MKEIKESRKTRYTRMVLQDSLTELMKQKPISKITIKEICENADINRTSCKRQYRNHTALAEDRTTQISWGNG